jgi:hypothetical protein
MLAYGMSLLPYIRELKRYYKSLIHTWFADDGSASGNLKILSRYLAKAVELGKYYGYYINLGKTIIIASEANLPKACSLFRRFGIKEENFVTDHRNLGGYIGDATRRKAYVQHKLEEKLLSVTRLAGACQHHPQAAYCVMAKSLQMEWQYLQRVTVSDPSLYAPLEDAIAKTFLPALFHGTTPPRTLTSLPRKAAGLGLSNPQQTQTTNHTTSKAATAHLTRALADPTFTFSFQDHSATVKAARNQHQSDRATTSLSTLLTEIETMPAHFKRALERAAATGQWLSVIPTLESRSTLSAAEFHDALCLRYGLLPVQLPKHCDGCHCPFSIEHALVCKKGGLVILRHNELRDTVATLAAAAFTPSAVRLEPKINPLSAGPDQSPDTTEGASGDATPAAPPNHTDQSTNARGDLLVRGLVTPSTDTIIDFAVTHLDSQSYLDTDALKLLHNYEKSKNRKYKSACMNQRRDFVPFITSCDGMIGPHAKKLLQRIAQELSKKWSQPFSSVTSYVYSRISLSLVRSTHMCLRGSRVPVSRMSSSFFSYDESEGLYHLRHH